MPFDYQRYLRYILLFLPWWIAGSTIAAMTETRPAEVNTGLTATYNMASPQPNENGQNHARIVVQIEKLRSTKGILKISLFNRARGFPIGGKNAFANYETTLESNRAEVVFDNLPKGTYAVSVWHDENANQKIDTNWVGLPVEGLAVSNDAQGTFGPPEYEDACFELEKDSMTLVIHMSYF